MITEAIILAGGLGSRLQRVFPGLPKAMAPVAGKPFISYVIDYLRMQGVQHIIFSLGFKAEIINKYLEEQYDTLNYKAVIENELLGTGGAIKSALAHTTTEDIIVTNGDTLFKVDYSSLTDVHFNKEAACTLGLTYTRNISRYGAVKIDDDGKILSFNEKGIAGEGLINGGVYILNKNKFLQKQLPYKFSFENDYLKKFLHEEPFYGVIQEGYFIDIGIPEDYEKSNLELARPAPDLKNINQTWSLFLDRDGVLNEEVVGKYIFNWNEFKFSDGVLKALKKLNQKFIRIVVVSNQRGIGRNLMSEQDLEAIHKEMQKEINAAGGRIDKIYYCTEADNKHPDRKPNPGMALKAFHDFPEIDPQKSIMVGNKPSDMRFGRAAGMVTVFITSTNKNQAFPHADIDFIFPSLQSFVQAIES